MTKLMMTMVLLPLMAVADTETVDGIAWTYTINSGKAEVRSIPSTTTGAISVPLALGGKPVTSIGSYAFEYCSGLKSVMIPSSVTSIGSYAFYYCNGLKSLTIPKSVTDIGYSAFCGCTGLESIALPFVGTSRGNGGNFSSLFGSGSGSVPATLTKVAITDDSTLSSYAFQNCKYIENITLPIGVSSIGHGAFQGCESLRSVSLPVGVSEIGSYAFQRCLSLTDMTIPVGVQQLESSVFEECLSLARVSLPIGLTSIGYGAFRNCRSLYRINVPNTVTSISSGAFAGCTGLGSGVVVVDRCLLTVNGNCPANVIIDKDVRLIVAGAFSECESVQSVTINAQIEELPEDLFEYCSNLKKVVLPASLRVIGGWAFCGCYSLEDIQLPEGLLVIDECAFAGCAAIRSFNIPASVTGLRSLPTGWYDDWDEEVYIPSKLVKLTVESGNKVYAAYDNVLYSKDGRFLVRCLPGASSLAIRKGTKYITYGAFQGCYKLTDLTIPEGIVAIGDLWDWTDIEWPSFGGDDSYGPFDGCTALRSLSLPSTLEWIYDNVEMGNLPALTKLTVAAGNKHYFASGNVLYDKENSRLVYCPPSLNEVKIWDKTVSIAAYAFDGCDKLESLTIPASVKRIGHCPFWGCEKLKAVYYKGDAPFPIWGCSWEEVDEEAMTEIQDEWNLYALSINGWGGGCMPEPEYEYLDVTSYVQKGTKWWGDSGEWQGRPLVFVDSVDNPVVKNTVTVSVEENCAELGSVSGGNKAFKAGDKVSVRATAKKGAAFAYWECAGVVVSTSASYSFAATGGEMGLTAHFIVAEEDWLYVSDDGERRNEVKEALDDETWLFGIDSGSAVAITVKGLPPGVKSAIHAEGGEWWVTCSGAPTKEGVYWVTCTAKNGNGYQSSATVKWIVGEPKETDYDDIGLDLSAFDDVWTGQDFYWNNMGGAVPVGCDVPSLTKIAASGLPTGLKLQKGSGYGMSWWEIVGSPTKAGKYAVTLTATYDNHKTAKAVKTVVVRDSGSAYLHVDCGEGYESCGTVTGFGVSAVGAKVKLTAKPAKGYYFAGWYSDPGCGDRLYLDSGDWRKASDSYQTGVDDWPEIYAKFVSKEEDVDVWIGTFGNEIEETSEDEDTWFVRAVPAPGGDDWGECFFEVESETLPAITVSGLPSGCTWDKKTNRLYFPKQPAKPGLTKATIKAKNLSGVTKTRTLYVKIPNLRSEVFDGLDYEGDYRVTQGVSDACVESWCGFAVEGGWKVSASGLPSGLKFAFEQDWDRSFGRIYGTPTKAGAYTVTLTAKRGGETQKATVTFVVDALPDYVVGKFSGLLQNGDATIGTFALTATAAGKQSVSLAMKDGTRKTYSANSWNCAYDGVYAGYFTRKAAADSCAEEGESVYFEVGPDYAWDQHQLHGEFMIDPCSYGGEGEIVAQRNPFGKVGSAYENVEAHLVAAELASYGKMGVWVDKADDDEYWLSCPNCIDHQGGANPPLTFTASTDGTVKVAGKIAGKRVSGSTTLRILDGKPQADFVLSVSETPIVIHVDFCLDCGGANGAATGWASIGY